jgi:hypothetical protein
MCLTPVLTSSDGVNLFESAYSPSFDPANLQTNYQGDAGASGNNQSFGISTTASTAYTIVVNDVSGTATGSSYSLQIPACALNCNVNHLPIALAHNVTVPATSQDGVANANINNGSSDPDGDPITLTQSPSGPYSVGNTSVLLTVVDTKGAAAQASATVTVVNPDFTLALTLPSVTVIAGQSAAEHITFIPNPGIGSVLTFTCSGLPALAACSFTPPTVPASSAAADVLLTITTVGPNAALARPRTFYAAWMPFAGLGLIGVVFAAPGKRRRAAVLLMSLFLMGVMAPLVGCGGGHTPGPGTPKGTSTVTVTGTSGNITHTATFSLTVN